MKAKVLSVLLAVMMIVGLLPIATILASAATPADYDIKYYISANGDNSANTGLTADSPLKTIGAAYKKLVAANPTEGKTVVFYVMGEVSTANTGNGFLDLTFDQKTVKNLVTVEGYKGTGYENTEAKLVFSVGAVADGSTRKVVSPGNYLFKDLTIVPDLATAKETNVSMMRILFSAGEGNVGFDNVTFAKKEYNNSAIDIEWNVQADATSPTVYHNHYDIKALTSANDHYQHDITLSFYNGDYKHLILSGAGQPECVSPNVNNDKNYSTSSAGVLKGASRVNAKAAASNNPLQPKYSVGLSLVIGDGAQMGQVSAFNWNYVYSYVNVSVKKGASVEKLYGAGPSALNFNYGDFMMPVVIDVDKDATVTKALCYADTVDYAGYKNAAGAAATAIDPAKITKAEITLKINGKVYVNGEDKTPVDESKPNFTHMFYVSATGDDANDGSEAAPFKHLYKAARAVEAIDIKAGETVGILVSGEVLEHSAYVAQYLLASSYNIETFGAVINIVGITEDAAVVLQSKADTDASSRRYAMHHLYFKNLTMKATGPYADKCILIGAGVASVTFDNVKFDSATKWRVTGDSPSGTPYTKQADLVGASDTAPRTFNGTVAFYNGDYTGLYEVGGAISGAYKTGGVEKNVTDGVPSSTTNYKAKLDINPKVIIGAGAKMGTVSGIGWNSNIKTITIEVQKGAEVALIQGTVDDMKISTTENTVYINVEEGATVGKINTLGANATFAGKVIVSAGPATGDSSMIVVTSVVALISLAAVVVLKKKATRA